MFAAKAATVLQSRLLGEKDQWSDAVMTWRRLQRALERRKASHSTSRRKTRQEEEEEQDSLSEVVERRKISGGPNESKVQGVGEPSGPGLTLKKKRKRDDEEEEEERTIATQDYVDDVKSGEKRRTPESRTGTGLDSVVSCCEVNGVISTEEELITHLHGASNISTMDTMAEGGAGKKVTAGKHLSGLYFISRLTFFHLFHYCFCNFLSFHVNEPEYCEDEVKNPPQPSEAPAEPVSFRISCKCTGAVSRLFSQQVDHITNKHQIYFLLT